MLAQLSVLTLKFAQTEENNNIPDLFTANLSPRFKQKKKNLKMKKVHYFNDLNTHLEFMKHVEDTNHLRQLDGPGKTATTEEPVIILIIFLCI